MTLFKLTDNLSVNLIGIFYIIKQHSKIKYNFFLEIVTQ